MTAIVVGTAVTVLLKARRFRTNRREAFDLILTLILPVLFGVVALLFSGQFMATPTFLVAALVTSSVGALLCWWPYEKVVCRFGQRLTDLDRFIRLHYAGYPWLLILLGAAFAPHAALSAGRIGALLLVALCFHIYSCVLNDVLDLAIDRTQIRRRNDPLVRGSIDRRAAHVFALIQLPMIALVTQLASGESMPLVLIAIACALMGAYNRWGKLCPIPPLTDVLQGVAWGILALYGAWIAGGLAVIPWIVFAYGAGFMSLINGIHGGLRDLANDLQWKRTNTALFLGARPDTHDPLTVRSTAAIAVFAFAVQTLMLAPLVWVLYRNDLAYYVPVTGELLTDGDQLALVRGGVIAAFVVVAICCHALLWRLVRPGRARRDEAGSMHAFAILLPPLVVFWPALGAVMQVVVPLCFFLPLLVQFVDPILGRIFPALRGRLADVPQTPARGTASR
jgi:4-hydroxybenzoate polyprenyltransferase